jgi:hypothetical protein
MGHTSVFPFILPGSSSTTWEALSDFTSFFPKRSLARANGYKDTPSGPSGPRRCFSGQISV